MEKQSYKTNNVASKTWMPVTAGILSIVAGAMGLIAIVFLITFGATFGAEIAREVLKSVGFWQSGVPLTIIGVIVIPLIIINAIAIIGGIYALQRRGWGLSLAGAICAILPAQILGIIAIVFIAISKKEFE
ncbi:MAG: hypothetical protein JSV32_03230 [Dehalococcoidia bacterium]|nr:MAG: hypothetical protein JSV32_03230 [Dehalococcoidia bacterium]